jgi:hypothetical protein
MTFYGEEQVLIQNIAPYWNGKIGIVVRWVHDNWYIVAVEGKELVLDTSRDEMVSLEDHSADIRWM